MKSILILSAGRRVELVGLFKKAVERSRSFIKIIAADMDEKSPALYFADKHYIVPSVNNHNFIENLLSICIKENVKVVIPTIDTELPSLAGKKSLFSENEINVFVPDLDIVNITYDKWNTYKFFVDNCILTPATYIDRESVKGGYEFPLFIKPRLGSSSINAYKVNNREELDFFFSYVSNPLIQEYIKGEEYTVDAFCDLKGSPVFITPRLRLAVRGGEILKGRTVKDRALIEKCEDILLKLKGIGPLTIQCIKRDSRYYFTEINSRFGGGAPMSIEAGADSVMEIIKLVNGEEIVPGRYYDFKEGLLGLRYDQTLFL